MSKLFISSLFLFLLYPIENWDLKKEKSGIAVYTRSVEGSDFDEFKAETIIENANIYDVLNVLMDVENYINLYPDCYNPEILEQNGKWNNIHYILTKAPFPVKDRDGVNEITTTFDENGKSARVTIKPLPDYIPEKKGIVRIQKGAGFWQLTEENNGVAITYQYHGDPAGDVPAWLANSFVVTHPYKTIVNMRNMIKSNKQTNKY